MQLEDTSRVQGSRGALQDSLHTMNEAQFLHWRLILLFLLKVSCVPGTALGRGH